jgi:hypothetical protein
MIFQFTRIETAKLRILWVIEWLTGCDKWMLDDRPWATLRSCDFVHAWLVGGKWLSRTCQMFFKPF